MTSAALLLGAEACPAPSLVKMSELHLPSDRGPHVGLPEIPQQREHGFG